METYISKHLDITWMDYPTNEDSAIIVYFFGCSHGCPGCHNIQFSLKDKKESLFVNIEQFYSLLMEYSNKHRTNKVIFSGGDPLFKDNIEFVKEFLNKNTFFDVCVYTGHEIEYVVENNVKGFEYIKCGKFQIENKRISGKTDEQFILASNNQKIYDKNCNLLTVDGILNFTERNNVNV